MFAIFLLALVLSRQSNASPYGDNFHVMADEAGIAFVKFKDVAVAEEKRDIAKRDGEEDELDKMIQEEGSKAEEAPEQANPAPEQTNAGASTENKGGDEDSELEKLIAEEGAKADEPLIAEEAQDARSNEIEENEHANAEVKKTLAEYIHELELNKELAETDKAAERKVRNEDFYRKYDEVAAVAIEETDDAASGIAVVETAASDVDAPPAIVTTANPSKTEASFFLKKY